MTLGQSTLEDSTLDGAEDLRATEGNKLKTTKNFLKGAVSGVSSAVTGVNAGQVNGIDQLNQKKIDSLSKQKSEAEDRVRELSNDLEQCILDLKKLTEQRDVFRKANDEFKGKLGEERDKTQILSKQNVELKRELERVKEELMDLIAI